MRLVGGIIVVLLVILGIFTAAGYLLPRSVAVERSVVIDAPPEEIFPHLNSLQAFAEWWPWTELDPAMQPTFSGPPRGVGNRMTWESDDPRVGSGTQTITVSVPNERVESEIDFDAMGTATASEELEPARGGTLVTWTLSADVGGSPFGRYMGLMLDRSVGADYARGLARLKEIVEEAPDEATARR
jgi:uncharacterized protein YndB with AHSA1/START domain